MCESVESCLDRPSSELSAVSHLKMWIISPVLRAVVCERGEADHGGEASPPHEHPEQPLFVLGCVVRSAACSVEWQHIHSRRGDIHILKSLV